MSTQINRRDFLRLAGLSALGVVAAACTPKAAGPTAGETAGAATPVPVATAASTGKTVVRWQDWPDWEPFMDKLNALLEAKLPTIKVEFEPLGDGFDEKNLTQMVAGSAPDVMTGWGPIFAKWAERNQLLDLQPLVDKTYSTDQVNDFFKFQWDGMVFPGTSVRFAMPYYVNVVTLLFNKEAFDAAQVPYPTKDWDHVAYADAMLKLTKKEGDKKQWGGFIQAWDYSRFQFHIQAFGGHVVNPGDWTECWLDKPEAQDALEWIRARMWDDNSIAQPLQVEKQGEAKMWPTGMVATEEGGMGNLLYYTNDAPFKWDMTHLPKGPARRATLATTDGWAIYKGTKVPDAAWELMKVLVGDDLQKLVTVSWGTIPNRKSLLASWKDLSVKGQPKLAEINLDVVTEMMQEGYPMATELFKKHSESEMLIVAALQKVYEAGETPTSYFKEVAAQVTKANREE